MKIQYIGTAAAEAIPGLLCECGVCREARELGGKYIRGRSGALINDDLMIDFPPDVASNTIKHGMDITGVENIIFTHCHGDHVYPEELYNRRLGNGCFRDKSDPLMLYGSESVKKKLQKVLEAMEKHGKENSSLRFTVIEKFVKSEIGRYYVTPLNAKHGAPESTIYLVEEKESGKRILYAHDTYMLPHDTLDYLQGIHCDLVSLDCTFGLMSIDGGSHMSLHQNSMTKDKLIAAGVIDSGTKLVVNHFSHHGFYKDSHNKTGDYSHVWPFAEFERCANDVGFMVSYDGMIVEL